MVQSPLDFFVRRTGRLYFDIHSVRLFMETVIKELGKHFKSDKKTTDRWKKELEAELHSHSNFSLDKE